jgi:hypothetical protein
MLAKLIYLSYLYVLTRMPIVESDPFSTSAKTINLVDKGNQVVLSESIAERLSRLVHAIKCFNIVDEENLHVYPCIRL